AVRPGQIQEHPRPGFPASAPVGIRVGTEPPVRERAAESLVQSPEAPAHLRLADLPEAYPGLIGDDAAGIEGVAAADERLGDPGEQDGITGRIDHGTVLARQHEGAAPIQEERTWAEWSHEADRTTALPGEPRVPRRPHASAGSA